MKINSQLLNKALKRVAPAISTSSVLPSLNSVLLKENKIIATNLNLTYIDEIGIQIENPILLPFKKIIKITEAVENDDIQILNFSNTIKILAGSDIFEIGKPVDVKEFPEIPCVDQGEYFEVDKYFFKAIQIAAKCIDPSQSKGSFVNICLNIKEDRVEVAGGNGGFFFRDVFFVETGFSKMITLDPIIASAIFDFNVATVSLNNNFISLKDSVTEVLLKLSDIPYVDYSVLFAKIPEPNIKIEKTVLLSALNKAKVYDLETAIVKFVFLEEGTVLLDVNIPEVSNSVNTSFQTLENSVEIQEIRFNIDLLEKAVKLIDSPNISIAIQDPKKPMCFFHKDAIFFLSPLVIPA